MLVVLCCDYVDIYVAHCHAHFSFALAWVASEEKACELCRLILWQAIPDKSVLSCNVTIKVKAYEIYELLFRCSD